MAAALGTTFTDLAGVDLPLADVEAATEVLVGRVGVVDLGSGLFAAAFLTTAGSGGERGRTATRCDDRVTVW